MRKKRISVSLPPDMLAHYKVLAEESGISVSRLIYLRLRSKKISIVVVGQDMLNAVQEHKTLVRQLLQSKPLNEEVADSLIRYSQFLEDFVELNNTNEEILKGGDRRGD